MLSGTSAQAIQFSVGDFSLDRTWNFVSLLVAAVCCAQETSIRPTVADVTAVRPVGAAIASVVVLAVDDTDSPAEFVQWNRSSKSYCAP